MFNTFRFYRFVDKSLKHLLDLLKKTPNSRVVNVSSAAGRNAIINVNQLNHYPEGRFSNWKIYSNTKAYNILFTIELAARLRDTSVTTYSLHPGVIKSQFFTNLSPIVEALSTRVLGFFMKVAHVLHNIWLMVFTILCFFRVASKGHRPVFIAVSKKELSRLLAGISTTVILCALISPFKTLMCLRNCGKSRKN